MDNSAGRWQQILMAFGSIVLIVAALYWAKEVLMPVVLAVLLSFVLSPIVLWLQHLHVPRVPAALLVAILGLSVLGLVGLAVFSQLEGLAVELPRHKDEIVQKIRNLQTAGEGSLVSRIANSIRAIYEEVTAPAENAAPPAGKVQPVPVTPVPASAEPTYLLSVASPALTVLLQGALVLVLVVFMLIKREDLRNRIIRLSGEGSITRMTKALDDAANRISRFLQMQLAINAGFGLAVGIGLAVIGLVFGADPSSLVGVRYAFLWGMLAGALRYIPYIGSWIAAGLVFLLAALQFPGWGEALLIFGLFVVLELVTANVVEPWLLGHSIGVSEVALLVSAAFWAWLWGPVGLLLSAPLTAVLAVMGKYVPQMTFFDVLLGDEPVLSPSVRYYQRLLARDEEEAAQLVEEYHREHCGGQVFDDVLLPALTLTTVNRDRSKLTEEDAHFIFQVTRELIDDLPPITQEEKQDPACATEAGKRWEAAPASSVLVLGCPARGEADELPLHMLGQMLDPRKCRLEVVSAATLSAEVLDRIETEKPGAVLIASLPPRGMTYTRYLCKRLRARFPELKIFVLLLGREASREQALARLQEIGVDEVANSLEECRGQLLPLVPVLEAAQTARQPALAVAGAAAGGGR
jgi:predicted PurR-regulated permease PerM